MSHRRPALFALALLAAACASPPTAPAAPTVTVNGASVTIVPHGPVGGQAGVDVHYELRRGVGSGSAKTTIAEVPLEQPYTDPLIPQGNPSYAVFAVSPAGETSSPEVTVGEPSPTDGGTEGPVDGGWVPEDTVSREGLVISLPFNGNAVDVSGSNRRTSVSEGLRFVSGRSGRLAALFGQNDWVRLDDTPGLSTNFTVAMWARWPQLPSIADPEGPRLLSNENGSINPGLFALTFPQSSSLQVFGYAGSWIRATSGLPAAGQWHHVAVVGTPGQLRFVVDGREVTRTETSPAYAPYGQYWTVGNYGRGSLTQGFAGEMLDFRLYARALDDAEIAALLQQ